MDRRKTKIIQIGNRFIGGGNTILIQSMTNTKTEDVKSTVDQIQALTAAGCEIIRCAVPTMEAARAIGKIKKEISIPLDSTLTAAENAKKYFDRYGKLKRTFEALSELTAQTKG